MSSWFNSIGTTRECIDNVDIDSNSEDDFLEPVNFGDRFETNVRIDEENVLRKLEDFDAEYDLQNQRSNGGDSIAKIENDDHTQTTGLNLQELDYVLEKLQNMPKINKTTKKVIYERTVRDRSKEDNDFLSALSDKIENTCEESLCPSYSHESKPSKKNCKIANFCDKSQPLLVQDLRPSVLAAEEKRLNAIRTTVDILGENAAKRVARLSRMRQSSFSSSDSDSDEIEFWNKTRQNIKKNNSILNLVHTPKSENKINEIKKTISADRNCVKKCRPVRSSSKMLKSKMSISASVTIDNQYEEKIKETIHCNTERLRDNRNSRIIFNVSSSQTLSITTAEAGALTLYRQYLRHHAANAFEKNCSKTFGDQKKGKKNKFEFPKLLNLNLKNLPPLFDCEISRRPIIPLLANEEQSSTLLLSVSIASLNCPSLHASSKTSKKYLLDSDTTRFGLSFSVLISWLLSLVPKNTAKILSEAEENRTVPFNVTGLQQVTRNNSTYLDVFIDPVSSTTPGILRYINCKKQKKRKKYSDLDEFLSRTRRFLASTKLADVAPWLWKRQSPVGALLNETEWTLTDKPLSQIFQLNPDPNAVSRVINMPYAFEWAQIQSLNEPNLTHYKFSPNETPVENCFGLILGDAFGMAFPILEMLIKISLHCMDLCGLRLSWLTKDEYNTVTISQTFNSLDDELIPCLAICVRGAKAINNWQSIVGPRNAKVARYTDEFSLSSIYGLDVIKQEAYLSLNTSPESCIFYSPRSNERSHELLMHFFSGSISDIDLEMIESGKLMHEDVNHDRAFLLTAVGHQAISISLSPRLPIRFISDCINTIQNYGFQIEYLKRHLLNAKQLKFIDEESLLSDLSDTNQHIIIIELSRENALQHAAGLLNRLQEEVLSPILSTGHLEGELKTLLYSTMTIKPIDNDFQKFNQRKNPVPPFDSWQPDCWKMSSVSLPVEESVCMVIVGSANLSMLGVVLLNLLHGLGCVDEDYIEYTTPASTTCFEILGIKYVKGLSHYQAREICPLGVGDANFLSKTVSMYDQSSCCLLLRRLGALAILLNYKKKVKEQYKTDLIVTTSASWSHRVIRAFFDDVELYQDDIIRSHEKYLPEKGAAEMSIFKRIFHQDLDAVSSPILIPPPMRHQMVHILRKIDGLNARILSIHLFTQLEDNQIACLLPDNHEQKQLNSQYPNPLQYGPVYLIVVEGVDVIRLLNLYFTHREKRSNDFDRIWLPNSYQQSKHVLDVMCPAGTEQSRVDYDVSLNSAPICHSKDNEKFEIETALLVFKLENSLTIFDKTQRSNFDILGLRTARLSHRTVSEIFKQRVKDIDSFCNCGQLIYCVLTRSSCFEILNILNLPVLYSSESTLFAEEEIPKLFAELLVV